MIKVGIIERDVEYLTSLTKVIRMEPNINVLQTEKFPDEFLQNLPQRLQLDIVFIDLGEMEQLNLEVLPIIKNRFKKVNIVVLSDVEEETLLFKALSKGADGFLIKGFPVTRLPSFIKIVYNGGAIISPIMTRKLVDYFHPPASDKLSAKEMKILQLLADGQTYKSISHLLDISVNGVKYHIKNIYRKLEVNNKIDAINYFKHQYKHSGRV